MSSIELRNVYPVLLTALFALQSTANEDVIRFDMPPTVAAVADEANSTHVECELRLSSLVASPTLPRIDQWLVRCTPRSAAMRITDYAPRTETRSEIEGPIQYKISDEDTNSVGLNINGDYAKIASGNFGADSINKKCITKQYNQVAAVQAVTASGTINHGRGVYFKLRWTATQVLEGEKRFKLTMRVPASWRGGLIDVSVNAQSAQKTFGGLDTQIRTLGQANFVIAAYRADDSEAADRAFAFSDAEQRLRQLSADKTAAKPSTLPSMLRHVAAKLDLDSPPPSNRWIGRLTAGKADPYLDREISRLPMSIRVAAIEYHDKRNEFTRLGSNTVSEGS